MEIVYQYQLPIRFTIFLAFFVLLSWWEAQYPWRPWLEIRIQRWFRHFGINLISKILLRLLFPMLLIGVALLAQQQQKGLFNNNFPQGLGGELLKIVLSIIVLDLFMYIQHRLMHRYPLFWRFHRVHHMDRTVDVSTGLRFHPIEEIYTMAIKMLAVAFIGAPPMAVFIFEVWYNFVTLWMHLNVALNEKVEIRLRRIIVTPGMHRIHHSDYPPETNSNYGFIFSWWDRFFDSYTFAPHSGQRKMVLGLEAFKAPFYQTFINLLLNPFDLRRLKPKPEKKRPTKMRTL